jgi:hypothetical protein
MDLEDTQKDVERLFSLLEDVRLLLLTALPRSAPQQQRLSWEDVWRNASYSYVVRPKKSRVYELI